MFRVDCELTILDLTGSVPSPLAGATQDFKLTTAYYKATVPLWIDLIVTPSEWSAAFLSEEAKEVLGVLGGLVVVFPVPTTTGTEQTRDLIRSIGDVVKQGLGGWEWDGVGLAVGVGEGPTEEWDEMCAEVGLEFVHLINGGKAQDRNEFGGEHFPRGSSFSCSRTNSTKKRKQAFPELSRRLKPTTGHN